MGGFYPQGTHNKGSVITPGRGRVETTGTEGVVARDVAQHPTMREVHPGEQPGPNVHSATGKKPQGCHEKASIQGK